MSFCQVCGNKARPVNYGTLTCESCSAFFRRHGFHPENVGSCRFKGQCEMHKQKQQRRICTACRLAKCLAVGMNINFNGKDIQKLHKYHSATQVNNTLVAKYQSSMFVPQLSTLDLLNRARPGFTASQWTLLSNVVHAYDTFSSIPDAGRTIEHLPKSPILHLPNASITMKLAESVFASMNSFVRSIPDFQILTINEQRSLLERNLQVAVGLDFTLVVRDSCWIDNSTVTIDIASIYGFEDITRIKRLKSQLDSDSTLIKVMLVILTLSSSCLVLNVPENTHNDSLLFGTFRLLGSQNVYVELLWKYMIYRYGYHETAIRFAYLVKQVLDMIDHLTKMYMGNNTHRYFVDGALDDTIISSSNSENEYIPLWGITELSHCN